MRKIALVIIFLLGLLGLTHAQDEWQEADSGVEYNCEMLALYLEAVEDQDAIAISEFMNEDFIRSDVATYDGKGFIGNRTTQLFIEGDEVTVEAIFFDAIPTCENYEEEEVSSSSSDNDSDTFNVIVNGNVNVRSCAGTDCDVVGQATAGSVLTVLSEEEDWYEVEFEDDVAFIASWLTERGPDIYIEDLTEVYVDERTGCYIVTSERRGDMEVQFALSGDDRSDIFVDLYRPNDDSPLDVEAQLSRTFNDTGDPYIQQYYHWGLYWYTGVYEMELTFDGETSRIAWNIDTQADILIYIDCG